MTIWFVSRHPGAQQWAAQKGFTIDKQVEHLNPDDIQADDKVLGTLPIHLAAQVCQKHAEYWHLSLDIPAEWRGKELSTKDLQRFQARLEQFTVMPVPLASPIHSIN